MSEQPSMRPTARPNRASEHIWAIENNGRQLACELRDDGAAGMELQVYRERELLYGRRFATRVLALEKADDWKAQYLRGWERAHRRRRNKSRRTRYQPHGCGLTQTAGNSGSVND